MKEAGEPPFFIGFMKAKKSSLKEGACRRINRSESETEGCLHKVTEGVKAFRIFAAGQRAGAGELTEGTRDIEDGGGHSNVVSNILSCTYIS